MVPRSESREERLIKRHRKNNPARFPTSRSWFCLKHDSGRLFRWRALGPHRSLRVADYSDATFIAVILQSEPLPEKNKLVELLRVYPVS